MCVCVCVCVCLHVLYVLSFLCVCCLCLYVLFFVCLYVLLYVFYLYMFMFDNISGSLPQVFNVNVEVMFQMLFTDSEFMREFMKSRNVTSE